MQKHSPNYQNWAVQFSPVLSPLREGLCRQCSSSSMFSNWLCRCDSVSAKKAYNSFKGSGRKTGILLSQPQDMKKPPCCILWPRFRFYVRKVDYFWPNTVWKVRYKLTVLEGKISILALHICLLLVPLYLSVKPTSGFLTMCSSTVINANTKHGSGHNRMALLHLERRSS